MAQLPKKLQLLESGDLGSEDGPETADDFILVLLNELASGIEGIAIEKLAGDVADIAGTVGSEDGDQLHDLPVDSRLVQLVFEFVNVLEIIE